jgi:hypothetical protein
MDIEQIPADFPRPAPHGAVPGAQPKVLARQQGRAFVATSEDDEVLARFQVCEDLLRQLRAYVARKLTQAPTLSKTDLLKSVNAAIQQKAFGWGLSPAETNWILKRIAEGTEAA